MTTRFGPASSARNGPLQEEQLMTATGDSHRLEPLREFAADKIGPAQIERGRLAVERAVADEHEPQRLGD